MRRAQKMAPHPRRLFALAMALKRAGDAAEADRTFAAIRASGCSRMDGKPDNANHELIYYYTDSPTSLPMRCASVRLRSPGGTIFPLSTPTPGLCIPTDNMLKHGPNWIRRLKVGIRDARLFDHAANIAEKLSDRAAAAKI